MIVHKQTSLDGSMDYSKLSKTLPELVRTLNDIHVHVYTVHTQLLLSISECNNKHFTPLLTAAVFLIKLYLKM